MIRPSKHLDLDRSPIHVASIVINALHKRRIMSYESILELIQKRVGDSADIIVAPALNLLFLMNRLEYHVNSDAFEYIEPESN